MSDTTNIYDLNETQEMAYAPDKQKGSVYLWYIGLFALYNFYEAI